MMSLFWFTVGVKTIKFATQLRNHICSQIGVRRPPEPTIRNNQYNIRDQETRHTFPRKEPLYQNDQMAAFFYPIATVLHPRPPIVEEHIIRRITDCKPSPSLCTSMPKNRRRSFQ